MSVEDEENKGKPLIVARPVSKDVDNESDRPPAAKPARSVDDEDKDRDRDRIRDRDRDYRDDRYHGPPSYPPQYPPPRPFFSADNINKFVGLGLLMGIILLFIGTMMNGSASLVKLEGLSGDDYEDARDLQRNLYGGGIIIDGIGLFIISFFILLPLLLIRDLGDKQRYILILIAAAVIVGYTILIF